MKMHKLVEDVKPYNVPEQEEIVTRHSCSTRRNRLMMCLLEALIEYVFV